MLPEERLQRAGGWHDFILPTVLPLCFPPAFFFHPPLQAGVMLQKLKGQPLSLRVLRWQGHNGEVYEPLLPYLEAVKEKEPHFQLQCGPRRCDKGEKRRVQGGR